MPAKEIKSENLLRFKYTNNQKVITKGEDSNM